MVILTVDMNLYIQTRHFIHPSLPHFIGSEKEDATKIQEPELDVNSLHSCPPPASGVSH